MDDVDQDERSAPRLRAERIDAWFERKWPNRYERFVARAVIYLGLGAAWGLAAGQLVDVILDRMY